MLEREHGPLGGDPVAFRAALAQLPGEAPRPQAVAAVVAMPLVLPPTVLGFYLLLAFGPHGPGGVIASLAGAYTSIVASSTSVSKNVMPRVAATLDVAQISEICGIDSPDTFIRPIYAGNALATVKSADAVKVLTVRTTAFDPVGTQAAAPIDAPTSRCSWSSAAPTKRQPMPQPTTTQDAR